MFFSNNLRRITALMVLPFMVLFVLLLCVSPILFHHGKSIRTSMYPTTQVIVLDAGHGGEDCGTIGYNGVFEKDLNLAITMELGSALEDLGYTVVYTRVQDKLLYTEAENIKGLRKIYDLKNRVKIAEAYSAPIFISLHMNSFSDSKYSGLQVFYSSNNEDSYRLASAIQMQVKEKIQPENKRGVRVGENLYLMENLSCPAVLIECGFLSNPEECAKLCEKEYQKRLCFAILCGIIEENS